MDKRTCKWPVGLDDYTLVTLETYFELLADLNTFGNAYVKNDGTRIPPEDVAHG